LAGTNRLITASEAYKNRNVVERFFNRMKHWRALASRYASTPSSTGAASYSRAIVDRVKRS